MHSSAKLIMPQTSVNTPTAIRLRASLLNVTAFPLDFNSILFCSSKSQETSTLSVHCLLLEGARLANQLVEDLIAFDLDGRTAARVPRLPFFHAGVDSRAYVELYEAHNRDCIDGMGLACQELEKSRSQYFQLSWQGLVRSVRTLLAYLVH